MTKLTESHGKELLLLARSVIASRLGKSVDFPDDTHPVYNESSGTFVTLKKGGALRGCIGNIEAVCSIKDGIRDNALSAAFHDHRFSPLSEEELDDIHISISILTRAKALTYSDTEDLCAKIRPGIDGVILRYGRASSTFLPQVWEQLPSVEQFFSHLSLKAGLSKDAWREDGVEISVYQVQSFSEELQ